MMLKQGIVRQTTVYMIEYTSPEGTTGGVNSKAVPDFFADP